MKNWKKYVIEFGFGIDQHGQDYTNAAIKAVKDAISRCYLVGIFELGYSKIKIDAIIGIPEKEKVNKKKIEQAFPLKEEISIKLVNGGLIVKEGIIMKDLGDKTPEIIIANAAIIVYVA